MTHLSAGKDGPYTLAWDEDLGFWRIEARSLRAMTLLKFGVELEGGKVRIFGNTEAAERRAAAELERLRQMRDEAREIELPEIDGLKIIRTFDGLIRFSGSRLAAYKSGCRLRAVKNPFVELRRMDEPLPIGDQEIYMIPKTAKAAAQIFKAKEAKIRSFLDGPLPLSKPTWLALHQGRKPQTWLIEGPLALLDHMNIPPIKARRDANEGRDYRAVIVTKFSDLDEILEAAERRIEEIEAQIAGEEAQGFFAFVDRSLEDFVRRIQGRFGAGIEIARDGPWVNIRHDYSILWVAPMIKHDWKSCLNERFWRKSLLPLLAPGFPEYLRKGAVEWMLLDLEKIAAGAKSGAAGERGEKWHA